MMDMELTEVGRNALNDYLELPDNYKSDEDRGSVMMQMAEEDAFIAGWTGALDAVLCHLNNTDISDLENSIHDIIASYAAEKPVE